MPTLSCDLVGAHFRPPASAIIKGLKAGTALQLAPEPHNPYDTKAIRVLVDLVGLAHSSDVPPAQFHADLQDLGFFWEDLENPFHLGYIGDSDGKVCRQTGRPGNREVGQLLYRADVGETEAEAISATLQFAPNGQPLVRVEAP